MRSDLRLLSLAAAIGLGVLSGVPAASADDRHAGYYYPPPQTTEVYKARATTLPDSDRSRRISFVTQLTNQMMQNPYPPPFAMFAKGDEAEKLIIVAVYSDAYNTIYRGRALLAMLTANARTTPFFQEHGVEEVFTFFDLCKLLGFKQLTISDGDKWAHQVTFE